MAGLTVRVGARTALEDVSLEIHPGEVVALAGENGAGKTTLIRTIGGDVTPVTGEIRVAGRLMAPTKAAAARLGIRIVWQDPALADNLDVAANVMLGNERRRHMLSQVWLHRDAATLFQRLGIPLRDTTLPVTALSGGQRQMVAVARAMAHKPGLLLLDEPTASLGVRESELVEQIIMRLREQGTTVLLSCHDIPQMFRLATRILVLRHGRLIAEVSPAEVHPDDVAALVSGQKVDSSARRQLTRLHRLAGRLTSTDPSSSLSLILSALSAALGSERLCIHLPEDGPAERPDAVAARWSARPPSGSRTTCWRRGRGCRWARRAVPWAWPPRPGPPVIEDNIRAAPARGRPLTTWPRRREVASSWSVPVLGPTGMLGVITVFRAITGKPQRDDLDLATLYAGYAAGAIERDRLLEQVTARNRVLETIREVLQTLAGPVAVAKGLIVALDALRDGLSADELALVTIPAHAAGRRAVTRAYSGPAGTIPPATLAAAESVLAAAARTGMARPGYWPGPAARCPSRLPPRRATRCCWPAGVAGTRPSRAWPTTAPPTLVEDAAHSFRLALERESANAAHQEAMALRQSQEMQHAFLRRLSHELRTPLTAITGFASSLLQKDVTWDAESQHRFLSRISAESSRLGRLVNDLLDFSAIESGIFRLQSDWCDLPLVIDAAVALLPPRSAPYGGGEDGP